MTQLTKCWHSLSCTVSVKSSLPRCSALISRFCFLYRLFPQPAAAWIMNSSTSFHTLNSVYLQNIPVAAVGGAATAATAASIAYYQWYYSFSSAAAPTASPYTAYANPAAAAYAQYGQTAAAVASLQQQQQQQVQQQVVRVFLLFGSKK